MNNCRIIVSMDFADMNSALKLAGQLDPRRCRLKVGKELFTCSGPIVIEKLIGSGFEVFMDLKFHDIPNTVARACDAAADLGVWMLNVHATGGRQMLSAARTAIDKFSQKPLLVAVTVLTSLTTPDLRETGVAGTVEQQVLKLAQLSQECGLDGVVCSAHEASSLREQCGHKFCLVTPGIRPADSSSDDQQRIITPAEAVSAGSDYLVIGRPITQATDPLKALSSIEAEINQH